jgi:MerR family mercuric resistance operon transcriptional regulator
MTTGQLAKAAGVNIETIRYYERRGLIPRPGRRESGYREYPEETVKRIRFIKHAKELGFSLKEIGDLLSLRVDPETPCSEVRQRAQMKLSDIENKIAVLRKMKKALKELTDACSGKGPASQCPILDAIEK